MTVSHQNHLLFALLALHVGFVTREQLMVALGNWTNDKSKRLDELLMEQGAMDAGTHSVLNSLVNRHLELHGEDVQRSIAAVGSIDEVRPSLEQLGDPQIQHSLGISSRQDATEKGATTGTDPKLQDTQFYHPDTKGGHRFHYLRPHAEGGLGKVVVAKDMDLGREVALKEILPEKSQQEILRQRFVMEAEITGGLEHPGIVPVYALGKWDDGRPYYAMKFIRGETFKVALERFQKNQDGPGKGPNFHSLEFRQLIRRFIDVCNAMQYAHDRHILHRDIKPQNIMLGSYGETLVVDWGLAKSFDASEHSPPLPGRLIPPSFQSGTHGEETVAGSVMGTVQYMSPEQARGNVDGLTAASDVYGLGATLYHMLTGKTAFHLLKSKESEGEILQRVQRGDFPKPREIRPGLPLPLEAICLKAMALAPQDRYQRARDLALDLEHWLADEAVSAFQEPWRDRLARWTRRHRAWTQAGIVTLCVIAIVAVGAFIVVNRARVRETIAKAEATQRSRQAREAVDTLLTSASAAFENYPGMQQVRVKLLERAAADYEKFATANSTDPELRAESGRCFYRLGDVRSSLNLLPDSILAFESGIGIFESLAAVQTSPQLGLELGTGHIRLGKVHARLGKREEARKEYDQALELLKPLADSKPDNGEYGDALGTALVHLAELQQDQGEMAEAEASLIQAVRLFEKLNSASPDQPRLQSALAQAHTVFGQLLLATGRIGNAELEYQEAIRLTEKLVQEFPDEPEYLANLANGHIQRAIAFRTQGKYEDEIRTYLQAEDDYVILNSALPGVPRYRANLALTRMNLGQAWHKLKENPKALEKFQQAYDELALLAAEYDPLYLEELATLSTSTAMAHSDLGDMDEAPKFSVMAIDLLQDLLLHQNEPRLKSGLAVARLQHARILARQNRLPDAIPFFEQATEDFGTLAKAYPNIPEYQENQTISLQAHADARYRAGDLATATELFTKTLEQRERRVASAPNSSQAATLYATLLSTCPIETLRDPAKAIEIAQRATELSGENLECWKAHGIAEFRAGNYTAATASLLHSQPVGHSTSGLTLLYLAMTLQKNGQHDDALQSLAKAVSWLENNAPADPELQTLRKEAEELIGTSEPSQQE